MAEGTHSRPATSRNPLQGLSTERLIAIGLAWWGLGLAVLIALVSALFYVRAPEEMRPIFDDSYISLTFARNIAEHGKLSFDGESWSTGATSTLHVILLAIMLKLGFAPFFTSIAVGVGGMMLLAAGVYMLAWSIFRSHIAAICAAISISFMSYVPLDAGNGLETTLFMAMIAWAAATYFLSDRPLARWLTGGIIGLAILTRPEGVFLMSAFVVYRWLDRKPEETLRDYILDCIRLCLPGVLGFAVLQLYALAVTGELGGTGNAKLQFFQENQQTLEFKVSVVVDQFGLYLGPIMPFVILALLTVTRRAAVLLALFWVPVLLFYTILFPGGLFHYFFRYQHPTMPFIAAFAGGGLYIAINYAIAHRDWAVRGLIAAGLTVLAVYAFNEYTFYRHVYVDSSRETLRDLEPMALDLNTIIEPDETLAAHDIGAVGYYSDYEVLDLVGLVNPDALEYHNGRRLSEYLDEVKPEYILIFPNWDLYFLHFHAADNPDKFELVKEYPGGYYRAQPYMLYRVNYD